MKEIIMLAVVFNLALAAAAYADGNFDEIFAAVKKDSQEKLSLLEERYRGSIISGQGNVYEVQFITTNQIRILLTDVNDSFDIANIISVTVDNSSPSMDAAKKLKQGQVINFRGRLTDIEPDTVFIEGDVEISVTDKTW